MSRSLQAFNAEICPATPRQIENWIAAIRPRAEQVAALFPKPTETKSP